MSLVGTALAFWALTKKEKREHSPTRTYNTECAGDWDWPLRVELTDVFASIWLLNTADVEEPGVSGGKDKRWEQWVLNDRPLPVVECGGESVVLSDHIRKYGDNPLFRVKPCNLQSIHQLLYYQVWNHPVNFKVENSSLQQFYGHLNVSWIIIKVVKFDCNFDIVSEKFFLINKHLHFWLVVIAVQAGWEELDLLRIAIDRWLSFFVTSLVTILRITQLFSTALYWYLLATAIFNFYKLDNWWSLGITGDIILSSSNINSTTFLNTKPMLYFLFIFQRIFNARGRHDPQYPKQ